MTKKKNFNLAIVGLGNIGLNLYRHLIKNKKSIIDKNNDNGISTGKLLRNRPFILYCILTGLLTISLFFVDIPFLDHFTDHTYLNDIRIN